MEEISLVNDHEIFNKPFLEWVISNLENVSQSWGEDWPLTFGVTLWWIWRWRNNRCIEREVDIPFDQLTFIMARVGDIKTAWLREELVPGKRKRDREEVFIRRLCPREGWVKLNTDGATKGNPGQAGCGGIIRGHRGELFEMFAARCGVCSSVQAKLLGVLCGLAIAWNTGNKRVQLNVDSEVVVQLLTNTNVPNSPMFHTIRRCRSMVQRSKWEVSITHCYREANRAAD